MVLNGTGDPDDIYIPDEEEQREINEILNREDGLCNITPIQEKSDEKIKNRLYHIFNSEDHWAGWLKTQGIIW